MHADRTIVVVEQGVAADRVHTGTDRGLGGGDRRALGVRHERPYWLVDGDAPSIALAPFRASRFRRALVWRPKPGRIPGQETAAPGQVARHCRRCDRVLDIGDRAGRNHHPRDRQPVTSIIARAFSIAAPDAVLSKIVQVSTALAATSSASRAMLAGIVGRVIDARRPVQADIAQARPAAGMRRFGYLGGVGGDAGDMVIDQRLIGGGGEPTEVAGLADDRAVVMRVTQIIEEPRRHLRIEDEVGGSWTSTGPRRSPSSAVCAANAAIDSSAIDQPPFVRDRLGQLDRKPEAVGNACRPARIGFRLVRAIEARIDLDRVEPGRVAFEIAGAVAERDPPPLAGSTSRRCRSGPSEQPPAIGHLFARPDQHDLAVGIGKAERQNLRHERPDLAWRKIDHSGDLPPDEVRQSIMLGDLRRRLS